MKTYDVKLERKVTETATIKVEARDKRTAAFQAATQEIAWTIGEKTPLKIVAIDVEPQPSLPIEKPADNVEPIATSKKTARSV